MENNSTNDWLIEQEHLKQIKIENPELLESEKFQNEEMLKDFGINIHSENKPDGTVKALPSDFIVEEITLDGEVMTVTDLSEKSEESKNDNSSLFFKIIKTRISTLEAVNRISEFAGVSKEKINYAGIKDAIAVTGQLASTKSISFEKLKSFNDPNVVITNIEEKNDNLGIGSLSGNKFSIFVRGNFTTTDQEQFKKKIADISENGIPNFYGSQRFGSPRFISRLLGKAILQGDFKKVFEMYLFDESPYEYNLIRQIRRKMKQLYGDWNAMLEISSIMPHAFRVERNLIKEILKKGLTVEKINYKEILCIEKEQMRMWVYSYASFLANKILSSDFAKEGSSNDLTLPLLITRDKKATEIYDFFLTVDGTQDYLKVLSGLPFIYLAKENSIKKTVKPVFTNFDISADGISLQFDLPKSAYATILLQHLFTIKPYDSIFSEPAIFVDTLSRLDGRALPEIIKEKI